MSDKTPDQLADIITEYLMVGGLFNPEMMEHDKVRDLLMGCHTALRTVEPLQQRIKELEADKARIDHLVKIGNFHIESNRFGLPHIVQSNCVLGKGNNLREAIDDAAMKSNEQEGK